MRKILLIGGAAIVGAAAVAVAGIFALGYVIETMEQGFNHHK